MLESVRTFIKVVDQGSFSRAARILQVAPSSVTRNIDQLENELGVSLFKRSTRQLVLTEEGQSFLLGSEKLIAEADELINSLKNTNQEPEGVLRISVFETFGGIKVCPTLPEFLERYPKVKLEIDLDNRFVDLDKEDVDLAIRIGRPQDSSLKARKLLSNHASVCASPAYFEQYGTPTSPEDLADHNCLTINNRRQKTFWYFRKGKTSDKIAIKGNLTSTGGTALGAAALAGTGIVLASHWMVDRHINSGKLVTCLDDWECSLHEGTVGEVYAVYRSSIYTKPSIRAFIDFLVEKTQE